MASLYISKPLIIIMFIAFYNSYTIVALSSPTVTTLKISSIAAEPAVLPESSPISAPAPASSPDITPLFPTPASGLSPDSSLPTIPASPSPPNPDTLATPHPEFGIAPSGAVLESSALGFSFSALLSVAMLLLVALAF